jgi:flagellar hook-length control protein FliK
MSISSPLPVAAPPPASAGPPKGRSGSAPPDGDPFASVLDRQARTATAEGQPKQQDATPVDGRERAAADGAQPDGEATTKPAADAADPAALAAALNALLNGAATAQTTQTAATPAVDPAATAETTAPAAPAGLPATPVAETSATAPDVTGAPVAAPAPAVPAGTPETNATSAAVPSDAAPQAPAATTELPTTGVAGEQPTAPHGGGTGTGAGTGGGDRAPAGAPQRPVAPPTTPASAAADAPTGDVPQSQAAAAAPPAARAAAPAAQPAAATAAPASAPAAPGGTAPHHVTEAFAPTETGAANGRAVTLQHAVETVKLALRAGAERGVTHARITLTPVDLGSIDVHLRHTSDGLVARVVADSTGAAQLLQQSADDLRRTLEQQGVQLLRLDIGASGEQAGQAGAQRGFGAFADAGAGSGGRRSTLAAGESVLGVAAERPAEQPRGTLALSNGVIVDVLA